MVKKWVQKYIDGRLLYFIESRQDSLALLVTGNYSTVRDFWMVRFYVFSLSDKNIILFRELEIRDSEFIESINLYIYGIISVLFIAEFRRMNLGKFKIHKGQIPIFVS